MRFWKPLAVAAVGIAVVLASIPWGKVSGPKKKGPKVYVEILAEGALDKDVSATGTLEPREAITLPAEVLGSVEDVLVKEGDLVEAGQVLLRIDKGKLQETIDQVQAQERMDRIAIDGAGLRQGKADADLARLATLHDRGILSESAWEDGRLAAEQTRVDAEGARERLIQTQASLRALRNDLGRTEVLAPLTGTVLGIHKKPGEGVAPGMGGAPGTPLITLGDLSRIYVSVTVEEVEVAEVRVGQDASVVVDALPDRSFDAVVDELAVQGFRGNRGTVGFRARLRVTEPDPALRAGMSARVDIHVERLANVLPVPQSAILEKDDKEVAFVEKDGTVARVEVETGTSNATHAVVLAGLSAGDRVVTGPYRTLKDLKEGDPVKAEEEKDEEEEAEE